MNKAIAKARLTATASFVELQAVIAQFQAAGLRCEASAMEELRDQAHSWLDAHLDHVADIGGAARRSVGF